jgi:uncharacterized protein
MWIKMTIIDISGYFGHWPYWPIKTLTGPDLIALLDKSGIDQMVVASTRSIFNNSELGNHEAAELANSSAGRIHAFVIVNPTNSSKACDQLTRSFQAGIKGFRLLPQYHRYRLDDDPGLNHLLSLAQDLGMVAVIPIRLILHWGLPQLDVRDINVVAANFPRLRVIISGVNYGEFRDALAVMRRHENVGFETSCMQMVNGIETLVQKAGAERVYMGTGAPLMYPAPGVYKIIKAEINERDKELILGGNAARLLSVTSEPAHGQKNL